MWGLALDTLRAAAGMLESPDCLFLPFSKNQLTTCHGSQHPGCCHSASGRGFLSAAEGRGVLILQSGPPQDSLRAFRIFKRAARTAGRNPPTSPLNIANMSEPTMMEVDRANENSISANESKLMVETLKN